MSASLMLRAWHTPWTRLVRGTICEALPVDEAIAAARLPACLSALALQTARTTRLWPSEQADVARELAAHFEDGLAAGIDARTLIETFGAPAAAARLIRRAKKRARPASLKSLDRLGQSLVATTVITMATLAGFAARAWTNHATVKQNHVAAIEAKLRATTTRSWPALRQAILALPPIRVELDDAADHLLPEHEGWALAGEYLNRGTRALQQIRACAADDRVGAPIRRSFDVAISTRLAHRHDAPPFDETATTVSPPFPVWQDNPTEVVMTECGTLLGFAALTALHRGDAAEFRSILRDWLKLAEQLQGPATLDDQVAGLKQFERICRLVGRALGSSDSKHLSSDDLRAIAAMLTGWNAGITALDLSVEHACFLDWLQQAYTDDGTGDGHILGTELSQQFQWAPTAQRVLGMVLGPVLTVSRTQALELHQAMINDAQRAAAGSIIDDRVLEGCNARQAAMDDCLATLRLWPALMSIRHNLESLLLAPRHAMVQRDGILVAIAAELLRRETGAFPSSLEAFPPQYVACAARDPFNGTPLQYRLYAGQPLIYSIGSDRRDDLGKPPVYSTDNLLCRPRAREAGDWILYPIIPDQLRIDRCRPAQEEPGDEVDPGTCGAT